MSPNRNRLADRAKLADRLLIHKNNPIHNCNTHELRSWIQFFHVKKQHKNIWRNLIDIKKIRGLNWFLVSANRIRIRFSKFLFVGSGRKWTGSTTLGGGALNRIRLLQRCGSGTLTVCFKMNRRSRTDFTLFCDENGRKETSEVSINRQVR